MARLKAHKKALYELRFSTMCKPAAEVANLTHLESHTVRARTMMMWRIAEGIIDWGPREAELMYESTLDSISCAFDVFHYPIHRYMLDARADIWDAGLAPTPAKEAVKSSATRSVEAPQARTLLLAGEIAQLRDETLLEPIEAGLKAASLVAPIWVAPTGALAYVLGAWDVARTQAERIAAGIKVSDATTVIADGPETAWALIKVYPELGVNVAKGVAVKLLSEVLTENIVPERQDWDKVFVHDSRPAYLIAGAHPSHTVILPGYSRDESDFGNGAVYEAPRALLDVMGAKRVWGVWTRSLARTSGADDGLWLTYPELAAGLATQRLDYAERLGATTVVTDSPLAAAFLSEHAGDREIATTLLAELL